MYFIGQLAMLTIMNVHHKKLILIVKQQTLNEDGELIKNEYYEI